MSLNSLKNNPFRIFNPGLDSYNLPPDLLAKVKEVVVKPESTDDSLSWKKETISSIRYFCQTPFIPELRDFISDCYEKWCTTFDVAIKKYDMPRVWTNYMYKGDFVPVHDHYPAVTAFVIWVNIPYKMEDEIKAIKWENANSPPKNGSLEFIYNTFDGAILTKSMPIDRSLEGTMLMFPGKLLHCVYPFFSSEEPRISISGNIINPE